MQLVILQYKNYYNRLTKKESTIADYINSSNNYLVTEYDFNPADGVDTSVIIGGEYYDYQDSNYILVVDGQNIVSRLYILDADRTRIGQYKLSLHRDLMVDYWDIIKVAPAYIERAIVPDNSPFIWNSEGLAVNQIKSNQIELKDSTNIAWLVGYVDRAYSGGPIEFNATTISDFSYTTKAAFESAKGVSAGTVYKRLNLYVPRTFQFKGYFNDGNGYKSYTFQLAQNNNTWTVPSEEFDTPSTGDLVMETVPGVILGYLNSNNVLKTNIWSLEDDSIGSDYANWADSKVDAVESIMDKVLATTSDGSYWTIQANIGSGSYTYTADAAAVSLIQDWFEDNDLGNGQPQACIYERRAAQTISYSFNSAAQGQYDIIMPDAAHRLHLKDAPYDMFCIPFGNVNIRNSQSVGWTNFDIDKSEALSIAQSIATSLGTSLYDLQLLPYCPMTGFNLGSGYIDINTSDTNRFTIGRTVLDIAKVILLWATRSSGQFTISRSQTLGNKKIANECDMWRLVSPNGSGTFEFNAAKNNGISSFIVSYTYLPYSPYIQISPTFSGLYGNTYTDTRGLICQGDFSVSYLSNALVNYVNNNKNYAAIFDRQIQNMDVNRKYQRIGQVAGSITGAIEAGSQMGLLTGNVGIGVATAGLSAAGGIADMYISDKLFQESKSYAQDTHQYSLENIQAQPQGIAKTTAYTYNNTIFPVLEYYTCTEAEKRAIANKIAYEGMTVGVIGTINDYVNNNLSYSGISDKGYIRCKPLRLDIDDDFHLAGMIAQELQKGVYTK